MLMDSTEISQEQIGNFVEHLSKNKNVAGIKFLFNPFSANIITNESGYNATKSVVNSYVDWWETHPNYTHFNITIS